jgi:hypothetical protein
VNKMLCPICKREMKIMRVGGHRCINCQIDVGVPSRNDKILDKKYRFDDGSIDTFRNKIDNHVFKRSEEKLVPSIEYNRIKYNRMNGKEQEEYERKLKTLKTQYRLYYSDSDTVFLPVAKTIYDYFNEKRAK